MKSHIESSPALDSPTPVPHTRRGFLAYAAATAVSAAFAIDTLLPRSKASAADSALDLSSEVAAQGTILSHNQYLQQLRTSPEYSDPFNARFKGILQTALRDCVRDGGEWVVPSGNYAQYYFSRDSFWTLAALKDRRLLDIAAHRFHGDQRENSDGHIATALLKDGSRPENRDRDEESTMMDVLREWERKRAGGNPDQDSLNRSYRFILSHVRGGYYITSGETREIVADQIGTYHYWADTFRPSGRPATNPEAITYNQGLLCVSLRCLEQMGVPVDKVVTQQAENVYANTVNFVDGKALPQRSGSTIMDVSALVPEALSLYYFDRPLLSEERVAATLDHLAKVYYQDGKFLGFKVIADYYGPYRPAEEFSGSSDNWPGNYQNGGSWLLYDALALYAGIRHGIPETESLMLQRLQSEVRHSASSHEFIRTSDRDPGGSDAVRDNYGWNTFVLNLLP